ncbi:hypothetical protein, partial [Bacillus thuringiensis]|uniref:hypothetical protein n=1 Tax=Bacillus thuringiensis TaxID=1428 RepID=UPI001C3EAE4B
KVTKCHCVAFFIHRNEYDIHQSSRPESKFAEPPKPPAEAPAATVFTKRAPFLTRRVYTQQLTTLLRSL